MAENPYVMLEQLQLTEDLSVAIGNLVTRAGARLAAEQLYERGVRSRLHAPRHTGERVHFTSDPETGHFTISEPGVYELIMELDKPDVGLHPIDGAPVRPSEVGFYRLVQKAQLEQMNEVPGHITAGRRLVSARDGHEISDSQLFACPHCGQRFTALENGPDGEQRIPLHKVLFMSDTMECRGSRERVAPGVPNPVPNRPLPEAVQRVIHFTAVLKSHGWTTGHDAFSVLGALLTLADLEATLAEIPDVAPRYPTIWAYEQACRTIRERDARIEKALELMGQFEGDMDGEDLQQAVHDVEMTLRLPMPRIEPATDEEKSDVARAFEACDVENDENVGHWPTVARVLRDEALRIAGEMEQLAKTEARCSSCSHLVSSHYKDGSGCAVTVCVVGPGSDSNCPCTLDAWSEQQEVRSE